MDVAEKSQAERKLEILGIIKGASLASVASSMGPVVSVSVLDQLRPLVEKLDVVDRPEAEAPDEAAQECGCPACQVSAVLRSALKAAGLDPEPGRPDDPVEALIQSMFPGAKVVRVL